MDKIGAQRQLLIPHILMSFDSNFDVFCGFSARWHS